MYAFACTFATTRYFLSTSFVILHRSLKQHVNKKIFYRSHTRFKACSYSRESQRIFSPQQSNHFSLNLHFTRESENISIRSISNIYSDQFRIYLKFRYKVFIWNFSFYSSLLTNKQLSQPFSSNANSNDHVSFYSDSNSTLDTLTNWSMSGVQSWLVG